MKLLSLDEELFMDTGTTSARRSIPWNKAKLLGQKPHGAGKTLACDSCHGPDLKGVGQIPGIAGRSTNYVVRQLYDVKHGFHTGVFAWTRSVVRFSIAI